MWEKSEGEEGIFSGLFGIIEVRPSAGAHVGGALVLHRVGANEGVGGAVWFPLDQRPWFGLFVQAERPKGEQRQLDVAPPSLTAMEGVSAAVLHSLCLPLAPPVLVPFSASFSSTPLMDQSPKRVF